MSKAKPIYLDYAASTPLDPNVKSIMNNAYDNLYGNPSSQVNVYGLEAAEAISKSRKQIAHSIGTLSDKEIIFTSGATESNNLAILGLAEHLKKHEKTHIITTPIEHKSVLEPFRIMQGAGFTVSYLQVDEKGRLSLEDLRNAICNKTGLISIMHANNEIGTINDISSIAKIANENNIIFHCDAAQTFGKIKINVEETGIHLLSISAHKIYGPIGIGALYYRNSAPKINLTPLTFGGGQEKSLRSGTLPTPLILGFAEASRIADEKMNEDSKRITALRTRLFDKLKQSHPEIILLGSAEDRLYTNLCISIPGIEAETLIMRLSNEIAISNGSACTSGEWGVNHVFQAMKIDGSVAKGALRISLGRFTAKQEIDDASDCILKQIELIKKSLIKSC